MWYSCNNKLFLIFYYYITIKAITVNLISLYYLDLLSSQMVSSLLIPLASFSIVFCSLYFSGVIVYHYWTMASSVPIVRLLIERRIYEYVVLRWNRQLTTENASILRKNVLFATVPPRTCKDFPGVEPWPPQRGDDN